MSIPSLHELQTIPFFDNGEPLVELNLLCHYRRQGSLVDKVLVRESVAEKLYQVQKKLTLQLLIVEGYRHPRYQEHYYQQQLVHLSIEEAHRFVAHPSVAGHPTGGAVDLTLARDGVEIDMGTSIADFTYPDRIPTFSTEVSSSASYYRKMLHDLMVEVGFAPYYGEWWHFSYGDKEWAAFYKQTKTLYAPIS